MMLFKARKAAEREVAEALESAGLDIDGVRRALARSARLLRPLRSLGTDRACTTARLVGEVARARPSFLDRALEILGRQPLSRSAGSPGQGHCPATAGY